MTTLTKAELAEISTTPEHLRQHANDSDPATAVLLRGAAGALGMALAHIRAQDEKLRWHEKRSCSVCLGGPLPSGKPCICGGGGSASSEAHGLRMALYDANEKLRRVETKLAEWKKFDADFGFEDGSAERADELDAILNGEKQK